MEKFKNKYRIASSRANWCINDYIETNVLAWEKDMFFKKKDQ